MVTDGIEPATNGLLDQRSTDWAMPPTEIFLPCNTKAGLGNSVGNKHISYLDGYERLLLKVGNTQAIISQFNQLVR